jgi:DNA-binding GntR family transcriptional regulator
VSTMLIPPRPLVKQSLAAALREKIVSGEIEPGEVIVEGKWAAQFGVAQGSVREGLNILAAEGFVQKDHGHRARVIKLTREDVEQIYQMRGSLEGLAARLAVEQQRDLSTMEKAWVEMQKDVAAEDIKGLLAADLEFHLALCDLSGNRFLQEHARRLLIPLFAFVLMRVHTNQRGSTPWSRSVDLHGRMLTALRLGNPFLAEQFIVSAIRHFGVVAYNDWEATGPPVTS